MKIKERPHNFDKCIEKYNHVFEFDLIIYLSYMDSYDLFRGMCPVVGRMYTGRDN